MARKEGSAPTGTEEDERPGAIVVSVFGPFDSHALVMMTADRARALVGDAGLASARPARLLNAVGSELERLRKSAPDLADGALAASALAMAMEIEHPFNSATSKAACQARLAEALKELRELAPAEEAMDGIDQLAAKRAARRAGGAAT